MIQQFCSLRVFSSYVIILRCYIPVNMIHHQLWGTKNVHKCMIEEFNIMQSHKGILKCLAQVNISFQEKEENIYIVVLQTWPLLEIYFLRHKKWYNSTKILWLPLHHLIIILQAQNPKGEETMKEWYRRNQNSAHSWTYVYLTMWFIPTIYHIPWGKYQLSSMSYNSAAYFEKETAQLIETTKINL